MRCFALRRSSRTVSGPGSIHKILQLFARFEKRNFLRRYVHFLPGLGIAPDTPAPLPGAETAEPANLNLVALLQRVDDALENRFDDGLRLFAWKFRHP